MFYYSPSSEELVVLIVIRESCDMPWSYLLLPKLSLSCDQVNLLFFFVFVVGVENSKFLQTE